MTDFCSFLFMIFSDTCHYPYSCESFQYNKEKRRLVERLGVKHELGPLLINQYIDLGNFLTALSLFYHF